MVVEPPLRGRKFDVALPKLEEGRAEFLIITIAPQTAVGGQISLHNHRVVFPRAVGADLGASDDEPETSPPAISGRGRCRAHISPFSFVHRFGGLVSDRKNHKDCRTVRAGRRSECVGTAAGG